LEFAVSAIFQKMSEFDFNISNVARKNILELTPYRCARDVMITPFFINLD
jgi:hypothetical protein